MLNILRKSLRPLIMVSPIGNKTGKMFAMDRMNHPKADVKRIYLPREMGLTQLELAYKITTEGPNVYLEQTDDKLLKLMHQHDKNKKLYSVTKDACKIINELEVLNL